jgi:hypothetical protein
MVALRLRRVEDGAIAGFVEAVDTGPGFYDEMAQFAIVALGSLYPELEFTFLARAAEWRRPNDLRSELPAQPHGLALL